MHWGSTLKGGIRMDTKMITLRITDGPSRDMIFDSMKYLYETRIPLEFKFTKEETPGEVVKTRDIEIHTLQHGDGTGYRFNLEGYLDVKAEGGYIPRRFKAFYSAKSRKGTIILKKF